MLLLIVGAISLLGCVTVSDNSHQAAKANLHEASRINTQMGVSYFRSGQMARALDKLKRAIEEDPANADAHSALAVVYAQRGDTDLANSEYREALSLSDDNPDLNNNYGSFLCGQGKFEDGQRYLVRAIKSHDYATPEAALTNSGVCALRAGKPADAENAFREAVRINPDFPDALIKLARITYQRQDYSRAQIFMQRYQKLSKASAASLWLAAQIEQQLGNGDAARSYATQLVQQFPASDEAAQVNTKPASTP
jgi:type IV pilus assembly protein PilF